MDGVLDVVVGYSGGKEEFPTYKSIKDHTETLRVFYDPKKLSYINMLELFLEFQDGGPKYKSISRQYRSVLLPHTKEQKTLCEAFIKKSEEQIGRKLFVDIEDGSVMYRAEEYHQDYINKMQQKRF